VKVPDYGQRSVAISGTPSAPRNDSNPAAAGWSSLGSKLGDGLDTVEYRMRALQHARDVADASKITIDGTRALDELAEKADRDPDFRAAPDGFRASVAELRKRTVDTIQSENVRNLVSEHFDKLSIAKEFEVRKQAWGREKDDAKATLDTGLSQAADSFAKAGTPQERDLHQGVADSLVDGAASAGFIRAEDGVRLKAGFRDQANSLYVRRVGIDDPKAAAKLVAEPGALGLSEDKRVPLSEHFEAKAEALRQQQLAEARKDAQTAWTTERAAIQDRGFGTMPAAVLRSKLEAAGQDRATVSSMMGELDKARQFYNDTTRVASMSPGDQAALVAKYDAPTKNPASFRSRRREPAQRAPLGNRPRQQGQGGGPEGVRDALCAGRRCGVPGGDERSGEAAGGRPGARWLLRSRRRRGEQPADLQQGRGAATRLVDPRGVAGRTD
jgi:hypothetical protein